MENQRLLIQSSDEKKKKRLESKNTVKQIPVKDSEHSAPKIGDDSNVDLDILLPSGVSLSDYNKLHEHYQKERGLLLF
jgi:hypothetical protein